MNHAALLTIAGRLVRTNTSHGVNIDLIAWATQHGWTQRRRQRRTRRRSSYPDRAVPGQRGATRPRRTWGTELVDRVRGAQGHDSSRSTTGSRCAPKAGCHCQESIHNGWTDIPR